MGIVNDIDLKPSLDSAHDAIIAKNTALYNLIYIFLEEQYNSIWNDTHHSPSQIMGTFGKDAQKMFQAAIYLQMALGCANPKLNFYKTPGNYNAVNNPDGSITVTLKD